MIVPKFWAEGRLQQRSNNRQVSVRRFGWSDVSQDEAQTATDLRTREALRRILAGEKLVRREPKLAYNGAEGVPIREEIVAERDSTVITRNLYGALCLNTPDVLFADIDFDRSTPGRLIGGCMVFCVLLAVALAIWLRSWATGFVGFFGALIFGAILARVLHRLSVLLNGGEEKNARRRVDKFVRRHPAWRIRLYRTPAGFRLLALHRPFKPDEPETLSFFAATGADRTYVQMCVRQQCFRARVSPKPWRIGISQHIRPRPGVWPIKADRLPERRRWIEPYEKAATGFASCRYIETLGHGATHAHAESVQRLHDDFCRATSGLPVA